MASQQLTPRAPRSAATRQATWQVGLLPSILIALAVGYVAAQLGAEWRQTLTLHPTDTGPGAALFVVGIGSALAMLLGLALLVSMDYPVGAWVFALGVGMIAGVVIGFVVGPAPELALITSWTHRAAAP